MTKLMKKYIELANEGKKHNELYRQLVQERHQKVLCIETNKDLFGHQLKRELIDKVFEFYDNDKQFKETYKIMERASHQLNALWEVATDDEKDEIEQYFRGF